MSKPYCGECTFFGGESIDGYGWCYVTGREQQCSDQCTLHYKTMTAKQSEIILHHYQKYRRGGKNPMPHPYVIGQAIDSVIRTIRKWQIKEFSQTKK